MMETSLDILNELKDLSPLIAGIGKSNVFTVPQGYFDNLHHDILVGIESETTLNTNVFSKTSFSDVPAGYFDNLADNILSKIKTQNEENAADELRVLSPMLYSIQNENVFEIPKGYFDNLADGILVQVKPQTKVVKMGSRNSFLKYAVAAVFTGVMALVVIKFTGSHGKTDSVIALGKQWAKENKFDEELAKVDEADILKYLEASGTDVNAALVANSVENSVEGNELPSQEEYLLDEKALDKYLNSINVDDSKN